MRNLGHRRGDPGRKCVPVPQTLLTSAGPCPSLFWQPWEEPGIPKTPARGSGLGSQEGLSVLSPPKSQGGDRLTHFDPAEQKGHTQAARPGERRGPRWLEQLCGSLSHGPG